MAALLSEFEYDIFISYRQNDNKYDGWVTKFVENLQKELEATIKVDISVFFDENPHDGLLDTHQVDETLAIKLKSLIFIPIVSQTYCDPNSFAWQHEFLVFKEMSESDSLGKHITLPNGNIASRILPVKIHNLDEEDQNLLEKELGGPMRAIDFVHEAPGINRPLDSKRDDTYTEENKTIYRDQINKVANSIKEVLIGIKNSQDEEKKSVKQSKPIREIIRDENNTPLELISKALLRRNIPQVILVYTALSIVVYRMLSSIVIQYDLPQWFMTVSLTGLVIAGVISLVLAWMFEFAPEGLIRTRTWESRLNPYPAYKRKPFTGVVTIIALSLVLLFQTFYFSYYPSLLVSKQYPTQTKVVAIMPFENLNEGTNDDYYSNGLTADIITQLSKVAALTVLSEASIKQFLKDSLAIRDIGNILGASVILRSKVIRFGNKVRINCQLEDVESSKIIWGEIFDEDESEIFAIYSNISLHIAEVLGTKLTDSEKLIIKKEPTSSITAYDHYLKGRNYYYKLNKEANDSAIMEFKRAIRLDSEFALAWAGLGDSYSRSYKLYSMGKAWNDSSMSMCNKAISLDPDLAEAYKGLANAFYYNKQYKRAHELLETAVELNPNYAAAVSNLGNSYFSMGNLSKSIELQMNSFTMSPNNNIPPWIIGWAYRLLGELDKSEHWLNISLGIKPLPDTYRELGYTYVMQGKREKALLLVPKIMDLGKDDPRIQEEAGLVALFANEPKSAQEYFKNAMELNPKLIDNPNTIAPLALAYFKLNTDQHDQGMKEINRLQELYINQINEQSEDDDPRYYLAAIMSMKGNHQESIKWIGMAMNVNWNDLAMVEHVPWFNQLKKTKYYSETIEELKANLEKMRKEAISLD